MSEIIRASTPTHEFVVGFNPADVDIIRVSYAQNGFLLFLKEKDDFTVTTEDENYVLSTTLTQRETLRFNPAYPVEIQMRAVTSEGGSSFSEKWTLSVEDVIDREVINEA